MTHLCYIHLGRPVVRMLRRCRGLSRTQLSLMSLELFITTIAVALSAHAYPDRYRSRLWENGGVEGWNSNPKLRIYFYANHREPPEIPLIWTQA